MRVLRRLLCSSDVESDERRVTVDIKQQLIIKERTDAGPAAVDNRPQQATTDTQRLVDSGVGWAEQMLQQVPFVTCVLDTTGNSLLYCGGVPPASAALASDCLYHILGGDADAVEEVLQCTDQGLVWQGSLLGHCMLQRQLSSNTPAADTYTRAPLHAITDSTGTCSSQARLVQLDQVVVGSCSQEATQLHAAALQNQLVVKPGHADQSSPGQLSNLPTDSPGRCSGAKRTAVRWANSSNAQPVSAFMFAKQLKDPAAGGSPGRPTLSLPQPACSPGSSLEGSSSVQTGAGCSVARAQHSLDRNHSLSFAHQPRMSTSGTADCLQSQPQLGTVGPVPSQQLKERLRRRTKTATMLELLLAANHSADSASCQDRASRAGAPRPPSKVNPLKFLTGQAPATEDSFPQEGPELEGLECLQAKSCGSKPVNRQRVSFAHSPAILECKPLQARRSKSLELNDSTLYHTLVDATPPAPAAQCWRAEAAAAQSCGPARDTLPECARDSQGLPAGQELMPTRSATSPRPAVDHPHTLPVLPGTGQPGQPVPKGLAQVPRASSPPRQGGAGVLSASHHLPAPTQLPSGPAGPFRAPQQVVPLGWHQAVQLQRISDQELYCSHDGDGADPTEPSLREESGVQSHAMPRTPGPVQQEEPTTQPAGHGPRHPWAGALPPGMVLFDQPGVENIQVTVKRMVNPVTGQPGLLVVQQDTSASARMEALLADLSVVEYLSTNKAVNAPEQMAQLARQHKDVTLLFMDIVGFTAMSKEVAPEAVMVFLNTLFAHFDALCDKHGVMKVETAGDCYIVAGGILDLSRNTDREREQAAHEPGFTEVLQQHDPVDSAARVMAFAKDMMAASKTVMTPHNGQPVVIRIGLHTGNCVSGLESTCIPGRIQVSAATARLLPCEPLKPTGGIQVKGQGVMQTYLLEEHAVVGLPDSPVWAAAPCRCPSAAPVTRPLADAAEDGPSSSLQLLGAAVQVAASVSAGGRAKGGSHRCSLDRGVLGDAEAKMHPCTGSSRPLRVQQPPPAHAVAGSRPPPHSARLPTLPVLAQASRALAVTQELGRRRSAQPGQAEQAEQAAATALGPVLLQLGLEEEVQLSSGQQGVEPGSMLQLQLGGALAQAPSSPTAPAVTGLPTTLPPQVTARILTGSQRPLSHLSHPSHPQLVELSGVGAVHPSPCMEKHSVSAHELLQPGQRVTFTLAAGVGGCVPPAMGTLHQPQPPDDRLQHTTGFEPASAMGRPDPTTSLPDSAVSWTATASQQQEVAQAMLQAMSSEASHSLRLDPCPHRPSIRRSTTHKWDGAAGLEHPAFHSLFHSKTTLMQHAGASTSLTPTPQPAVQEGRGPVSGSASMSGTETGLSSYAAGLKLLQQAQQQLAPATASTSVGGAMPDSKGRQPARGGRRALKSSRTFKITSTSTPCVFPQGAPDLRAALYGAQAVASAADAAANTPHRISMVASESSDAGTATPL
ncbi:hypothetical protein QJQ45_006861 [Haematococcus lacustris]|nr:hypothetical protein QJQ45_006861 [Haematococcus lacustris]